MDRKSIIVLAISMLFIMSWYQFVEKMYPPKPRARGTNVVAGATNNVGTNAPAADLAPAPVVPGTNATPDALPVAEPEREEQLVTLETEDTIYTFTSRGGGLKQAELKRFPNKVGAKQKNGLARVATLNDKAPTPVLTVFAGGVLDEKTWFDLAVTNGMVRAEKSLASGLRIVKEFRPSTNFLLEASVRLENLKSAGEALRMPAHQLAVGSSTPINAHDDGLYMFSHWYDGAKELQVGRSWFDNKTLGCFPGTPRSEYVAEFPVKWLAGMNQFFTVAAIPEKPAAALTIQLRNLPVAGPGELAPGERPNPKPFGLENRFSYGMSELKPGAENALVRNFTFYLGPKKYNLLTKLGKEMKNDLDLIMDYDGFFGWFAKILLLSMNGLHGRGLTYAWSIIVITIIIKLLFWPLTNASTKSMKRMSELQPQMKALQEKYKDNPQKMNQKLMEFMKENKVNPMGGCLPMLLQLPVFFGFFTMLRGAVELRGAEFLWVHDLSSSDTVAYVLGFPINPLPIIMGATMLWQSTMTPPSPGMDPAQQKILKYMPMIFVVFLYNFSSALTLYWTVQNLLTILQTKITKASAAKQDGGPAGPARPAGGGPAPVKKRRAG